MHAQPIFRDSPFVTREGLLKTGGTTETRTLGADGLPLDISMDIFHRGLCLPSDNKMTAEEQEVVVEVIKRCFE